MRFSCACRPCVASSSPGAAMCRACRRLEAHIRASFELRSANPTPPCHAAFLTFECVTLPLGHSKFALRLHAETGGQVAFRRLPQGHPQFLRCRRAALENVKADFFVPEGRYTGITVLDVFKIDNKVMLKRFQRASASLEAGKVKVRGDACQHPVHCQPQLHTRRCRHATGIVLQPACARNRACGGVWHGHESSVGH